MLYILHLLLSGYNILSPSPNHFTLNIEQTIFFGFFKIQSTSNQIEFDDKWFAADGSNNIFFSFPITVLVFFAFIGVLIGLLVVYYWNRILKKILKRKKETELQLKALLLEVKKSDEDKKVLLQEIHHRVKNNLQIVSSMLNMQANSIEDRTTKLALNEAKERIQTIALVHNKIYKSPTIGEVDLRDYTQSLFEDLKSQDPVNSNVQLSVDASSLKIAMDSLVPLALILNELYSNSLKHAFIQQDNPLITVKFGWEPTSETLHFIYKDNGTWKKAEKQDSFGTTLIDIFTEQIDGEYTLNNKKEETKYGFKFKISSQNIVDSNT